MGHLGVVVSVLVLILEVSHAYLLAPNPGLLFGSSTRHAFQHRQPSTVVPSYNRHCKRVLSATISTESDKDIKEAVGGSNRGSFGGVKPELSRVINIGSLGSSPSGAAMCRIKAKPSEKAALAKRFDISELIDLSGELTIEKTSEYIYTVKGMLNATVNEMDDAPVVSIHAPISTRLLAPLKNDLYNALKKDNELPDYDEEIPASGDIDMGEILAQHLSLEYSMMYEEPNEFDVNEFKHPIG